MVYPQAAHRLGWLLDATEEWLDQQLANTTISRDDLRRICPSRIATGDEIRLVIAALVDLRILNQEANRWRIDAGQLRASSGYRRGVRDALQIFDNVSTPNQLQLDLVIALPPSVDPLTRQNLLQKGRDLRSALIDLIASSQSRIVLASPFWDAATTEDLKPLLERRIAAGVQVDLLGRSIDPHTSQGAILGHLANELGATKCRVFAWPRASTIDRFGSEPFI